MRQLALTLRPEPFETQNSFASRLAARNGCATAYEFCHDMRMSWRALINGDRDHLQRLEGLSGLNRGTLINTAIRSSDPYAVQIGNETFKSWIMRRAELRLCPACYRDGSHSGRTFMAVQSLEAIIATIRTCRQHAVQLIEMPVVAFAIDNYDVTAVARRYREIADRSIKTMVSHPSTRVEIYLFNRLAHSAGSGGWIDSLPIHVLAQTSFIFGVRALLGPDALLTGHSDEIVARAENTGFMILEQGPESVIAWLEHECVSKSGRRGYFGRDLGPIYRWLSRSRLPKEYEPVKKLVRSFIARNYAVKNTKVIGGRMPHPSLTPTRQIKQKTGISEAFFRDALKVGLIDPPPPRMGDLSELGLFTVDQIEGARARQADIITAREATETLGCSYAIVLNLMQGGLLGETWSPEKNRHSLSGREVDRFMKSIEILKTIPELRPDDLSFASAAALSRHSHADIMSRVLKGEFPSTMRLSGPPSISGIVIRQSDLSVICSSFARQGMLRLMAAAKMGVQLSTIRDLVEFGYLETVPDIHPITKKPLFIISEESFAAFNAQYVSLAFTAREIRAPVQAVQAVIRNFGIRSLTVKSGSSQFIERKDLPKIKAELSGE